MNLLIILATALLLALLAGVVYKLLARREARFSEKDTTYCNDRGEHLYYDRKQIRWREQHASDEEA